MTPRRIDIIPANPGFRGIGYDKDAGEAFVCGPIISWRIETFFDEGGDDYFSSVFPITSCGSYDYDLILNPDGSVTAPGDGEFRSLEEYVEKQRAKG